MTAPKADRSDYVGCGLWAAGFLVLVIVSFAVGVILRPDSPSDDVGGDDVTLTSVGPDGGDYRLVGRRDEADDPCVLLFEGSEEVTGQCGVTLEEEGAEAGRYGITSSLLDDGTTVVFGPVPSGTETVTFELSDGSTAEAQVERSGGADISFFVHETDEEVVSSATFLGSDGEPIPEPG